MNDNNKFVNLFIFKKRSINGIVPITDAKKIFLKFVILLNNVLTPSNIT